MLGRKKEVKTKLQTLQEYIKNHENDILGDLSKKGVDSVQFRIEKDENGDLQILYYTIINCEED